MTLSTLIEITHKSFLFKELNYADVLVQEVVILLLDMVVNLQFYKVGKIYLIKARMFAITGQFIKAVQVVCIMEVSLLVKYVICSLESVIKFEILLHILS